MRALIAGSLLLAASAALAFPLFSLGGLQVLTEIFNAPLNTNGTTPADPSITWNVTGSPAPNSAWWADDATGAGAITTEIWSAGGTPDLRDSPWCADGSHSDVTTGDCMATMHFDGNNENYTSSASSTWNPNSGDFSVCSIFQCNGQPKWVIGNAEATTGEGWLFGCGNSLLFVFRVCNSTPTCQTAYHSTKVKNTGEWNLCCMSFDYSDAVNGIQSFCNGLYSVTAPSPGGTIVPSSSATIGEGSDGSIDLDGSVTTAWFWSGTVLAEGEMMAIWEYWQGVLDTYAAPVAVTNTGTNVHMVDEKLEPIGDDLMLVGGAIPAGMTGAGAPASGWLSMPALTNSAPYSFLISSQTPVGTPTETPTSTDLFRDQRQTIRVCDDSAVAVEGESTGAINLGGLITGGKVAVCVYAKDSSGTVLDLEVDETGADSCAGGFTRDFDAKTITTAWTHYQWTHTLSSGDCTSAEYKISPTDWATVASQTCAEWVMQVYIGQDWCPPTFITTSASAVGANDDLVVFDESLTSIATGVPDGTKVSLDYTPIADNAGESNRTFFEIEDTGTANDYYLGFWDSVSDRIWVYANSTEQGGDVAIYVSTSAWTPVPGTTYKLEFTISNSGSGALHIDSVSEPGSSNTIANPPDSLDDLIVCARGGGTLQARGWCDNAKIEVP